VLIFRGYYDRCGGAQTNRCGVEHGKVDWVVCEVELKRMDLGQSRVVNGVWFEHEYTLIDRYVN
jgi:hypothetical protein